jgi:hypothetical protein
VGTDNADLLREWGRAKREENDVERVRLEGLINQSQDACPHPSQTSRTCGQDSRTGKYKKGQVLVYCCNCSKILRVA